MSIFLFFTLVWLPDELVIAQNDAYIIIIIFLDVHPSTFYFFVSIFLEKNSKRKIDILRGVKRLQGTVDFSNFKRWFFILSLSVFLMVLKILKHFSTHPTNQLSLLGVIFWCVSMCHVDLCHLNKNLQYINLTISSKIMRFMFCVCVCVCFVSFIVSVLVRLIKSKIHYYSSTNH